MPQPIEVRKVPILKVTDASGMDELIDKGVFKADDVLAIVGKTEGNGGVNDYTRILADRAFRGGARQERAPALWEEVSPDPAGLVRWHLTASSARTRRSSPRVPADQAPASDEPRVSVGIAMSEEDPARGHRPRRRWSRRSPRACARRWSVAGITDPADVHYVQTKTPLLVLEHDQRRQGTRHRRSSPRRPAGRWTCPTARPRSASRSALGEIEMPTDEQIMQRSVAVLVGGVLLLGRRARPGADRPGRQRARRRRALPRGPRRHARRARLRGASGRRSATPAWTTCLS